MASSYAPGQILSQGMEGDLHAWAQRSGEVLPVPWQAIVVVLAGIWALNLGQVIHLCYHVASRRCWGHLLQIVRLVRGSCRPKVAPPRDLGDGPPGDRCALRTGHT